MAKVRTSKNYSFVKPPHERRWYREAMEELENSDLEKTNNLIYNISWARLGAILTEEIREERQWEAELKEKIKPKKLDAQTWEAEYDRRLNVCATEKLLKLAASPEKIAKDINVSVDFVLDVQSKMA